MKKPTDIERLFQRIGLSEMRYHEFVPEPDPVRARENWSLVDSSVGSGAEERSPGHVPLARPAPPVRRSGAFYDRVAELRERRGTRLASRQDPGLAEGEPPIGVPAEDAAPAGPQARQPLQNVFRRVRGEPAGAREPSGARESSSDAEGKTPLSQVFKRLS